jgi:hypothetical protein
MFLTKPTQVTIYYKMLYRICMSKGVYLLVMGIINHFLI